MNPELDSLGSIGGAAMAAGLLVLGSYGLGRLLLPARVEQIALERMGRTTEHRLLCLATGINLLATLGAALGGLKLLGGGRSVWLVAAAAVGGIIFVWRDWPRKSLPGPAPENKPLTRRDSSKAKPLAQVVQRRRSIPWRTLGPLLLAMITLGPALCYPTGWDELVYHHVLPRRWLADGWPAFYPDLPYSGFPSLGEILFWLVSPIERVVAPRLIGWLCWLVGLMITYRLLRRQLAGVSALVLVLSFALSGAVLMISANCYVETIVLMDLAAILLVLSTRAQASGTWRQAAQLGVLAGGAAAVKLTGLALVAVPIIWQLAAPLKPRVARQRTAWLQIAPWHAIYGLVAGAVLLPFYLRPWLLTGNPFYPYYAEWFTADPARLTMSRYHHALGSAFGMRSAAALVEGPVLLAFSDDLYDGAFGWQLILFNGLAALGAASVARPRMRRPVIAAGAVAVWLYLFWYFTAQQARFAVPAALAFLILAALGLKQLHGARRKLALAGMLIAALISVPWRTSGHYLGSWLAALGVISPSAYVDEATDREYLPLVKGVVENTPADARLMVLFEHRGFYLPRRYVIGTPFFQAANFTPPENFTEPERLMAALHRERITHVIITNAPAGPDQVPSWFDRLEHFLPCFGTCARQGMLRVAWSSERFVLLEVVHTSQGPPP